MDFSAWFEAYLDGPGMTFDARHNRPRIGRIVMARGCDATDVAILRVSFGPCTLKSFKVITGLLQTKLRASDAAFRLEWRDRRFQCAFHLKRIKKASWQSPVRKFSRLEPTYASRSLKAHPRAVQHWPRPSGE